MGLDNTLETLLVVQLGKSTERKSCMAYLNVCDYTHQKKKKKREESITQKRDFTHTHYLQCEEDG